MWHVGARAVWPFAKRYGVKVMLPVSMTIGYIGYKLENHFRKYNEELDNSSIIVSY